MRISPESLFDFTGISISIQISKKNTDNFINTYTNLGFKSDLVNELIVLYTDFDTFEKITPMLINSYIHRSFDLIPNLYISDLFNSRYSYSQLSMAFMMRIPVKTATDSD